MTVPRLRRVLTLCAVLLAAGCLPDRSGRDGGAIVRDSAGIRIVENPSPATAPDLLVTPLPVVEIPRSSARFRTAGALLSGVRDVALLSDGRIVVANEGSKEVHIYGRDGALLHSGNGGGPDQPGFQRPTKLMVLPGDTILVQDQYDRVWLDDTAQRVARTPFDQGAYIALRRRSFSLGGEWIADGSYLTSANLTHRREPPLGLYRDSILLVRVTAGYRALDSLGVYGGREQEAVPVEGSAPVAVVPPGARSTTWSAGALDGTIVIGDNVRPEIHLHHADGRRTWVRWPADPEALTDRDVEEYRLRTMSSLANPEDVPRMEAALARMEIPDEKAYYYRVHIGVDGSPWVRLGTWWSDPTPYLVFTPAGRLSGYIALPGRFTVLEAGPGYALGVVHGDDGRETVRMYELER